MPTALTCAELLARSRSWLVQAQTVQVDGLAGHARATAVAMKRSRLHQADALARRVLNERFGTGKHATVDERAEASRLVDEIDHEWPEIRS